MSFVTAIWNFQFALVPIACTYILFELPTLVRRITRRAYTPIYFAFFPLGYTDELYSKFFADPSDWNVGGEMTEEEKAKVRKRIVAWSVVSMIISTVIIPVAVGFLAAMFLTETQFWQFFITLIVVKSALLIWSLMNLRSTYVFSDRKSLLAVGLLYLGYLVVVSWGLWFTYPKVVASLSAIGLLPTISTIVDALYQNVFLSIVVVAGITWAFSNVSTAKKG